MNIKVNIKEIGSKRAGISGEDFHLEGFPQTVKELIAGAVHTCVNDYNERVRAGEDAKPLDNYKISDMSRIGKIAFGINYGGKEADENEALENALQSYEDGLFRIFIGENEVGDLSDKISLCENEAVTFIRLTMLSGRLW